SATGGTRRTFRSKTSPEGRHGLRSATAVSLWYRSTAARRGCWGRTCTSGRAPSGCGGCGWRLPTSLVFGRPTGTTTTETRGGNKGTGATDVAARGRDRTGGGDAARQDDRVRRPRLGRAPRGAAR